MQQSSRPGSRRILCHNAVERGFPKRAILVLDNAPCHPDVESLFSDDGEISCLYLPPNTTSLIQPMNHRVLETIKRHYKHDLLLCLLHEVSDGSMNIAEFSMTINIKDAVLMSAKSWDEVKEETIAKSWNKLLSFSDVNQRDCKCATTDLDIDTLMDKLDIPRTERIDWLTSDQNDPGYHEFTDDEIVTLAREKHCSEDESDGDEEVIPETVSHAQAFKALETVLTYAEQ